MWYILVFQKIPMIPRRQSWQQSKTMTHESLFEWERMWKFELRIPFK
jgi:hypothetical protein